MLYRKVTLATLEVSGQGTQPLTILSPYSYKLTSIEYAGHSAIAAIESGTNYQTKDDFLFSDAVLSLNYGF